MFYVYQTPSLYLNGTVEILIVFEILHTHIIHVKIPKEKEEIFYTKLNKNDTNPVARRDKIYIIYLFGIDGAS